MPWFHEERTNEKSPPSRADTIKGGDSSLSPSQLLRVDGAGRPDVTAIRPWLSVSPVVSSRPVQLSVTRTEAPATGAPLSSAVTQTSDERSEERRVGKECRARWSQDEENTNE